MPSIISTGGQTRTRNSYASSAQARLTLRVNGEEQGVIITPQGAVVQAGFDAPTFTPTVAILGAGNVPVGYYVYAFAYASSRYPFVDNAVTGGDGELWPRSSPSPLSAVFHVTPAAKKVGVTVQYTTRSDVDWIWIYRTSVQTTSDAAQEQADAGRFFFVKAIANDTSSTGTVVAEDNAEVDTGEQMELDNYVCPLFRFTVFDGFYWWGWGNNTLEVVVTLAGGTTITINSTYSPDGQWFTGRNGYTISFYGITTGGYDGRGNYYFKWLTNTTAQVYVDPVTQTAVIPPATGYTTAYLSAPSTTLYRSKALNPFSWGITITINSQTGSGTIEVPEEFAEPIGGGVGTAICLVPNERILKLDTQSPERTYALDLNAADTSDFIGTLRTLDEAQSVSSHFSQFPMRNTDGQSFGTGVNAKSLQIVQGDAQSQIPIGGAVITTLRRMVRDDEIPTFFHGVYDRNTELNCWWVKTLDVEQGIDTLIYQHAPTGTWGLRYMLGISASWTVYDPVTEQYHSFIGDEEGIIGIAFAPGRYEDVVRLDTQPAVLTLVTSEENTLVVTSYAVLNTATWGADGTTVTVLTDTPHGLAQGDVVQFADRGGNEPVADYLPGPYSIFNPTTLSFQVRAPSQPPGTVPQIEASIMAPISYYLSVLSYAGGGMFYIEFPDPITADSVTLTTVTFVNVSYRLLSIYDFSDASELRNGAYDLYIGGIPCYLRRYFTAGTPEAQKATGEIYITALDSAVTSGPSNTLLGKFYANYDDTASGDRIIGLQPNYNQDESPGPMFFTKNPPSDLTPVIGIEVLQISTTAFQLLDFTTKEQPA